MDEVALRSSVRPQAVDTRALNPSVFPFDAFEFDDPNRTASPVLRMKEPWKMEAKQLGTGQIIIGYNGNGTQDDPQEGDRRVYIDGDEIGFEEYTAGTWSTVNSIKIGGVDSNSLFYPFLQCRGLINPLADGINSEFFPDDSFRYMTFETDYNDQNGEGPSATYDVQRTTDWSKFGTYSLTSSDEAGNLAYEDIVDITKNISYLAYYNFTAIDTGEKTLFATSYSTASGFVSITMKVSQTVSNNIDLRLLETDGVSTIQEVIISVAVPVGIHSLGFILDQTDEKLYYIVDDTVITEDILALTRPETYTLNVVTVHVAQYVDIFSYYMDDLLFSTSNHVNPDIFTQHYNHNLPWNTSVSTQDIILKPAANGQVVAYNNDTGLYEPVLSASTGYEEGNNLTLYDQVTDQDRNIEFASDADLLWDESEDEFNVNKDIRFQGAIYDKNGDEILGGGGSGVEMETAEVDSSFSQTTPYKETTINIPFSFEPKELVGLSGYAGFTNIIASTDPGASFDRVAWFELTGSELAFGTQFKGVDVSTSYESMFLIFDVVFNVSSIDVKIKTKKGLSYATMQYRIKATVRG